jgi:hypothetical protein
VMPNSVSSCTGSDAALRPRTCGMSGDNSLPVSASQTAWRWASIRSRLASSIAGGRTPSAAFTALYISGMPFIRSLLRNVAAFGMLAVLAAPFVPR